MRGGRAPARRVLECASVDVELAGDDAAALEFMVEYFDPWFRPAQRAAAWVVTVTTAAAAYDDLRRRRPATASPQPCFAHDQQVLALPAWPSGDGVTVHDAERSCFLRLGPGRVDVIASPDTRRWRFTLLWIVQEIAATRWRHTHVDLHAAAVAGARRGLLIAGPKNAGKTTLALHLMRSLGWRSIANDRSFVRGDGSASVVAGMPTAVKIRPATVARFPELRRGLPRVARPYLYTLAELACAAPSEEPVEAVDFALTPNQLALRLGAGTCAAAPLGAIVFVQVCEDEAAWTLEPLATADVAAGLLGNLYGAAAGERPATLFETFGGGRCRTAPAAVAAIASGVPGCRLRLGRDAYADGTLGARLARLLGP